jgi:hypothetical protein
MLATDMIDWVTYWVVQKPGHRNVYQGRASWREGPSFSHSLPVSLPTPESLQVLDALRKQQPLPLLGSWPLAASWQLWWMPWSWALQL